MPDDDASWINSAMPSYYNVPPSVSVYVIITCISVKVSHDQYKCDAEKIFFF